MKFAEPNKRAKHLIRPPGQANQGLRGRGKEVKR
jgi:hypothetical protein